MLIFQDWKYIQTLTGDSSWAPTKMRTYFEKIENNKYLPPGTPGHGFDGWLSVEEPSILATLVCAVSIMTSGTETDQRRVTGR